MIRMRLWTPISYLIFLTKLQWMDSNYFTRFLGTFFHNFYVILDDGQKKSEEECQERTFLTFSDHDTYRKAFPLQRRRLSQTKICPITRLPAKYFDPVTQHPYANLHAFKILRETYYNQLEQKGDKTDPEVKQFIISCVFTFFVSSIKLLSCSSSSWGKGVPFEHGWSYRKKIYAGKFAFSYRFIHKNFRLVRGQVFCPVSGFCTSDGPIEKIFM